MDDEIIVDDSFLSDQEIDTINEIMLKSEEFPWFLNQSLLHKHDPYKELFTVTNIKLQEGFQFNHGFYTNGFSKSPHVNMVLEVFNRFATKHNILNRAIIRAKANLTTQDNNNTFLAPHVDHPFDHKVFLYYVNDSDGDTIIYNEKWQKMGETVSLTERCRVSPKAGKAICFDGRTYHTPLVPQKSPFRAVINITFV